MTGAVSVLRVVAMTKVTVPILRNKTPRRVKHGGKRAPEAGLLR